MAVNYTDQDSITIDDINDTPISTGYNYTFGSVFGALNKIIKAFVNKFKNVDSEIITLHKGKTAAVSWNVSIDAINVKTKTYTINIDNANSFTHGFIKVEGTSYIITQFDTVTSPLDLGSVYGTNYADNSKTKGLANVTCYLSHNNGGTQLQVTFKSKNKYGFIYNGYQIEIEVH